MLDVRFTPADHRYFLGDRELASVTKILHAVLQDGSAFWRPEDRQRGHRVHRLTEVIDAGDWDGTISCPDLEEAAITKIINRGIAYQKFLDDTGFVAQHCELLVCSAVYGFGGKLDKWGICQDRTKPWVNERWIVDIKSGAPTPSAKLQVALYDYALFESLDQLSEARVIVELQDNANYRMSRYTQKEHPEHMQIALGCVTLYHWGRAHGLFSRYEGDQR
jgi:hypothetical protein